MALEVALAVQQELQARGQLADRLRKTQVERARYEVAIWHRDVICKPIRQIV